MSYFSNHVKDTISKKPFIGTLARRAKSLAMGTWKTDPSYWLPKLVICKKAQIVQIGSNDGKTGDPLYPLLNSHPEWKALFVEPVPYLFKRLKNSYPDTTRFTFENAAISNTSNAM